MRPHEPRCSSCHPGDPCWRHDPALALYGPEPLLGESYVCGRCNGESCARCAGGEVAAYE